MSALGPEGFASTAATAALVIGAVFILLALGWDSAKGNPTHATHSYLTEWAIDQLEAEFPELQQFGKPLVEGANEELHELQVGGSKYGVDLDAKRIQHKGTNAGCDDIEGWWTDCRDAYKAGDKTKAHFLLGIMLHMIEDMGVPAHANQVDHQARLAQLDHFEIMAFWNWKPAFDAIDKDDPSYAEPWKYYAFSRDWTRANAPNYRSRTQFSRTWTFAKPEERALLSNRQGRTCHVAKWTLQSAAKLFRGR
jgi:hypothetical protein